MVAHPDEYPRLRLPGLLVCEGRDDQEFLGRMLGVMGIPEGLIHIEQYAPKSTESSSASGETWISHYLQGLTLRPGFERVRSVGFVRDADRAPRSKLEGLQHHLGRAKLPVPRSHGVVMTVMEPKSLTVGLFIMPDGRRRGALEDLYLDAIDYFSVRSKDRAIECVDAFIHCLDPRGRMNAARKKKTRLQVWLSSRSDPTTRPGQAITWNLLPWDCPPLEPIRSFLRQLADAASEPPAPSA
jgi:hypothetical protein